MHIQRKIHTPKPRQMACIMYTLYMTITNKWFFIYKNSFLLSRNFLSSPVCKYMQESGHWGSEADDGFVSYCDQVTLESNQHDSEWVCVSSWICSLVSSREFRSKHPSLSGMTQTSVSWLWDLEINPLPGQNRAAAKIEPSFIPSVVHLEPCEEMTEKVKTLWFLRAVENPWLLNVTQSA